MQETKDQQIERLAKTVEYLEKLCKRLVENPEGTAKGDKAYDDYIAYMEGSK